MIAPIVRTLRLHQWAKNLLLFVPLMTAHRFDELPLLALGALAFLAFGLCASAGYVFNDLLDVEADRQHPVKRHRPFASGRVPLAAGYVLLPTLSAAGALVGLAIGSGFLYILLLYFASSVLYSLKLKRIATIDVLVLATLYTLRLAAGAEAVSVVMSPWLVAFSVAFFLSLAFLKRFSELKRLADNGEVQVPGRGYTTADLDQIRLLGTVSGYMSVVVFAFYVNSAKVVELYAQPAILWLACGVLLYWITRLWLLANRGELHDDPLMFALRDRASYIAAAALAVVMVVAT